MARLFLGSQKRRSMRWFISISAGAAIFTHQKLPHAMLFIETSKFANPIINTSVKRLRIRNWSRSNRLHDLSINKLNKYTPILIQATWSRRAHIYHLTVSAALILSECCVAVVVFIAFFTFPVENWLNFAFICESPFFIRPNLWQTGKNTRVAAMSFRKRINWTLWRIERHMATNVYKLFSKYSNPIFKFPKNHFVRWMCESRAKWIIVASKWEFWSQMQRKFDVWTQIAFPQLIFCSNVNIEYNVCAIYGHFEDKKPVKPFQQHIRMRTSDSK